MLRVRVRARVRARARPRVVVRATHRAMRTDSIWSLWLEHSRSDNVWG